MERSIHRHSRVDSETAGATRRMGLMGVPASWAVPLNFLAWLIIHVGAAWIAWKMPRSAFAKDRFPYRLGAWEASGTLYRRVLRINTWKRMLPDGAGLFPGGFPKATLQSTTPEYLEAFVMETRRAELTHWLAMTPVPLFSLWNYWWAVILMAIYAMGVNLPCILAQRYNRSRLKRVLKYTRAHPGGS